MNSKIYMTSDRINAGSKEGVQVRCGSARLAALIRETLIVENRRRRIHGDLPVAYEVQVASDVTSMSS